ncbi:MAG: hypothetical protein ACQESJ_06395 [Bacteroidota bacterium]
MKRILLILFFIPAVISVNAQMDYKRKVEAGFLKYQHNIVDVDPGPDWKGYNLDNEQNGIDINVIHGLSFKDKFMPAIGLGYLNFEGIHGISIFTDITYLPFETGITPFINLKAGYNHIWNQYENGRGSALGELGAGIHYTISKNIGGYIQSGFLFTQQSFLIPIRIGVEF